MHKHLPSAALLLMLVALPEFGRADRTDDFIKAEMQRQRIPGLSVAIVKKGEIIKAAGYGFANLKTQAPATPETVYKIASVSKQFIATGIMLLVQDDKIAVDAPIGNYLKDAPPTWQAITVRHLLTHTSGIVREAPGFNPFKANADGEVIRTVYPLQLRFAPGSKWEYGNVGYYALAEIIRIVSGQPWSEFLNSRVFQPSGMLTTFPTNTKASLPNRAQGYVDNEKLREAPDWLALRPSGAFLSTVVDLARWDAVLYSDRVLTESSRREMWRPVRLNDGSSHGYGFGWQIESRNGHKMTYHTGGMPGFRAGFARIVDAELTIIFLMNLDDVDPSSLLYGLPNLYVP